MNRHIVNIITAFVYDFNISSIIEQSNLKAVQWLCRNQNQNHDYVFY